MEDNSNEIKYLAPHEVADILKVKVSTIYQWRKQGFLKGSRIGRLIRFTEDEIVRFYESGRDKSSDDKVTNLKVRGCKDGAL